MMTLLIVSIALAAAAPLLSRQMKNATVRNLPVTGGDNIPAGAIMFFELPRCPEGWEPVVTNANGLSGFYPRLAGENDTEIGTTKEQMVHKHKHVSPFLQALGGDESVGSTRYGPFMSSHSYASGVMGDYVYPTFSGLYRGSPYTIKSTNTYLLRGIKSDKDFNNWYFYTSDGMNRYESLPVSGPLNANILTCPNRDESGVCSNPNPEFSYVANGDEGNGTIVVKNLPYLNEMPLVGNENRPNSVVWLACKKR